MDIAVLANQETFITFAMVMRLLAKKGKRLGKLLLYAFFLSIWKEKNRRTFENCESLNQTIKSSFFVSFLGLG